MVTIKDIARESGLSHPTVSQILNNRGQLYRAETRERVLQTAKKLGYRPHASARSMQRGRFGTVALIMSPEPHRSSLPAELLIGIDRALDQAGLRLLVEYASDEQLTSAQQLPRLMRELCCDGMLLNYHAHVPRQLEHLVDEFQLPVIWVNAKRDHDAVYPDDFDAGQRATQALIAAGHRRIAYLDGWYGVARRDNKLHYSKTDRQAGYQAAMQAAGLTPVAVLPADSSLLEGALEQLLVRAEAPTAFVAYTASDFEALRCAARGLGQALPDQLVLTTFGDARSYAGGLPLRTWLVPGREVGRQAVEMLQQKLSAPATAVPAKSVRFGLAPWPEATDAATNDSVTKQ